MDSGTLVGGGGDDGSQDKHRWAESKVYTRKIHRGSKSVSQQHSQNIDFEDKNSSQQNQHQFLNRFDGVSADSSSLNRRQDDVPSNCDLPSGNGSVRLLYTRLGNRVVINPSSQSKHELRELRRKLVNELDQVRNLAKKLEERELQFTDYSGDGHCHSQLLPNFALDNGGGRRVNSEAASGGPNERRPLTQVSVYSQGGNDLAEKEKRRHKVNPYYKNSEFILGKEKFPPAESNKKLKSNGVKKHGGGAEQGYGFGFDKYFIQMSKSCSNLLAKLMKHKHGWVFNTPVDVEGLGLHDYYSIIKHPMDLGTVKSRLNTNWYKSPREFAEDVRLTFRNAMTYNPKGHDVHIMAEQLSKIFEDGWALIESEYSLHSRSEMDYELPTPVSRKVHPVLPHEIRATLDRSESTTVPVDPMIIPTNFAPSGRTPAPKKPKAKDPNKRDMTYDEKQKLGTHLQSLPSEKLDNIVEIIRKRNSCLSQRDDEIEVDIDSFDAETLWELDRFVTNYKKNLSKHKRKAELALQARAKAEHAVQEKSLQSSTPVTVGEPKESKMDENNIFSSSPVQGEKQGDSARRSSSSSSSSSDSGSSSSDSDSESSSTFGSDVGHSPKA